MNKTLLQRLSGCRVNRLKKCRIKVCWDDAQHDHHCSHSFYWLQCMRVGWEGSGVQTNLPDQRASSTTLGKILTNEKLIPSSLPVLYLWRVQSKEKGGRSELLQGAIAWTAPCCRREGSLNTGDSPVDESGSTSSCESDDMCIGM